MYVLFIGAEQEHSKYVVLLLLDYLNIVELAVKNNLIQNNINQAPLRAQTWFTPHLKADNPSFNMRCCTCLRSSRSLLYIVQSSEIWGF